MNFFKNRFLNFLAELLTIFIGITLSFWFENYRQSNEERKTEIKYLEGFLTDLRKDKADLMELKSLYEIEQKSAKTILQYFEGKPLDVDTFFQCITGIEFSRHFTPNANTFEEVISSSNMKLISDQTIKSEILNLRSLYAKLKNQEDHVQHDLNNYLYNNLTTTIDYAERFNSNRESNDKIKRDIKKLMEVIQFKNFCVIIEYNANDLILNSYNPAMEKCDSLITKIESKLKEQ